MGWKDADALTAFATGKAAIFPMSTATAIPTLDKSAVKGKYAFAALPSVPFGATSRPAGAPAATTIVSGDNVAIASYTKNLDLALAYVKIISSPAMQAEQYTDFGNLPSNAAALTTVTQGDACWLLHRGGEAPPRPPSRAAGPTWKTVWVTSSSSRSRPWPTGASTRGRPALLTAANAKAQSSLDRAPR